jgi:hypothetical protein
MTGDFGMLRSGIGIGILGLVVLLGACSSGPPAPDWKVAAEGQLASFQKRYLEGEVKLAERVFSQALASIAQTGDTALTARAHLIRCAMQVASADFRDCPDYEAYARYATTEQDRNYHRFLLGQFQDVQAKALPEAYQPLLAKLGANQTEVNKVAAEIKDPVSRLVAVGVLLRTGRFDEDTLGIAVDAASEQGFRRPLLTYLKLMEGGLEKRGETVELERVRARIRLVEQSRPPKDE